MTGSDEPGRTPGADHGAGGRPDRRPDRGRTDRDRTDRDRAGGGGTRGGRTGGGRTGGPVPRGGPRQRSATAPAQRSRATDPARYAAYLVLRAVANGAYANLEAPRQLRAQRVHGRDAAFATELAYGTTRLRGLYDRVIEHAAQRPTSGIDGPVLDALRLGVHQLLSMRVPPHAAVDQTVALTRQEAGVGASTFVNAVLRRVGERDLAGWLEVVVPEGDPVAALAVRHSHPPWAVRALRAALLGHHASTPDTVDADLAALLVADNAAPGVTLAARPGLVEDAELESAGAQPSPLTATGFRWPGGDPGGLAAVREGRAAVQDEGSQLVASALAAAPVDGPDTRWLDLCAGPGGKAALLAAAAAQRGAALRANEISEHRAQLVRQTLAAAVQRGMPVEVTVGDGLAVGRDEPAGYDRVLVDAPCTGLGALRRRPEARWRRQPTDLPGLTTLQRGLLTSALDATRPGGVVGYATCSPHLAETRFLVADAIRRREDVEVADARDLFRDRSGDRVADLGDGPFVQLWPHRHGTDAMFFALLRRR